MLHLSPGSQLVQCAWHSCIVGAGFHAECWPGCHVEPHVEKAPIAAVGANLLPEGLNSLPGSHAV